MTEKYNGKPGLRLFEDFVAKEWMMTIEVVYVLYFLALYFSG